MKEKPNYYAILPAKVRYNKNISNSEKLFYAEVTALANAKGYCHATNGYLAELFDVEEYTITRWVKSLKKENLVRVAYSRKNNAIKQRRIYPLMDIHGVPTKMWEGYPQKSQGGTHKNVKENNTSSNTTSNNNYTADFEEFWEKYDNKVGKKKSFKKWKRLSESEKQDIFDNLPIFLTHYPDQQFRPHPQTYFNNRYWEDEKFQKPKRNHNGQAKKSGQGKENRTETFIRRGQELFSESEQ